MVQTQSSSSPNAWSAGKMVIFTAPSGAGKTSLVRYILHQRDDLAFSVSACTRPQRKNEVDGRDYYFLSSKDFENKIRNGAFLEWEEVYEGTYYGTLRSEVERIWQNGKSIVFDIDVQGALNIKREYAKSALAIFVKPPSVEVLEKRLRQRGTEHDKFYARRLNKAKEELTYENKFDCVIYNDDFQKAVEEAEAVVDRFLFPSGEAKRSH